MPRGVSDEDFLLVWNDLNNFPTINDVAKDLEISWRRCTNRASELRAAKARGDLSKDTLIIDRNKTHYDSPIPELHFNFYEEWTEEDCLESLRKLDREHEGKDITRIFYRTRTEVSDSTWNRYFGTFLEFKRQANLILSRDQHKVERQLAKHVSVDHYRELNDRHDYHSRYLRHTDKKHKIVMGASDLHDQEVDPFYLRCLIAAAKMIQPDIINLSGDIFDLPEFGKYAVDPRDWDVVGRIRFVHKNILEPLREAAPNAQIDFVEGNHEYRLLRHLADATPALRAVLSDLHGMTVPKLLGLDAYEINYISRADLGAFSEADKKKEIGKSYVIYDDALLVHHHPHAREWGLAGWNGHHHSWQVWHQKNVLNGSYQWMQLGCGHMLKASYTEGEFWTSGFTVAHLNTESKSTTFEYINVTDMAVIGGMFLYREPDEMVGYYAKHSSGDRSSCPV